MKGYRHMKKKITVGVPVYKAKETVDKLLASILV